MFVCANARGTAGRRQKFLRIRGRVIAEGGAFDQRSVPVTVISNEFISYQSCKMRVPYHVPGFAMLSLIPVMVFGCVLVI
jgi:hypothetical protein